MESLRFRREKSVFKINRRFLWVGIDIIKHLFDGIILNFMIFEFYFFICFGVSY